MIGMVAGTILVQHGCFEKTGSICCSDKSSPNTAKYIRLKGKQGFALNVFYCNKLTIAKCLFNGHDGNYLTE